MCNVEVFFAFSWCKSINSFSRNRTLFSEGQSPCSNYQVKHRNDFGEGRHFFVVLNVTIWSRKNKILRLSRRWSHLVVLSCVVYLDILITFRNGYRKIMQSIRITSRPPVTIWVMLRNNFQMLKRNCWEVKKNFPLPMFTFFIGLWVTPVLINSRTICLSICLFVVP